MDFKVQYIKQIKAQLLQLKYKFRQKCILYYIWPPGTTTVGHFRIKFDIGKSSYTQTGKLKFRKNRLTTISLPFLLHLKPQTFLCLILSHLRNGYNNSHHLLHHCQEESIVPRKLKAQILFGAKQGLHLNAIFIKVSCPSKLTSVNQFPPL